MKNYIERESFSGTEVGIYDEEALQSEAELAVKLMGHMAIVAAIPDGVDEAGRQKLRLMTPEEVVDRSMQIAELAWNEFRRCGWVLNLPAPTVKTLEEMCERPRRKVPDES